MEKTIILGGGPAGLTAGIYAARAGFSPLVVEGMLPGGQLVQTAMVENFPGFEEPVSGMALMSAMRKQAERAGARFAMDEISAVDFSGPVKRLTGMLGPYEAECVIVATGATARKTGLPGEREYFGRGISACATCDGAFFKGRSVAVIGGGDTALSDALYLAGIASKVHLIHRRDAFRGAKTLSDRVLANDAIEVHWNTRVESFEGENGRLCALALSGGGRIAVDGAFVAIGHDPQTAFLKGALELDEAGYIRTDGAKTSAEGVFAAGDCAERIFKQAVVAAGAGARAAIEACDWLRQGGAR